MLSGAVTGCTEHHRRYAGSAPPGTWPPRQRVFFFRFFLGVMAGVVYGCSSPTFTRALRGLYADMTRGSTAKRGPLPGAQASTRVRAAVVAVNVASTTRASAWWWRTAQPLAALAAAVRSFCGAQGRGRLWFANALVSCAVAVWAFAAPGAVSAGRRCGCCPGASSSCSLGLL